MEDREAGGEEEAPTPVEAHFLKLIEAGMNNDLVRVVELMDDPPPGVV